MNYWAYYAMAAWNAWLWVTKDDHPESHLFGAVIFVVLGTGERIISHLKKSKNVD